MVLQVNKTKLKTSKFRHLSSLNSARGLEEEDLRERSPIMDKNIFRALDAKHDIVFNHTTSEPKYSSEFRLYISMLESLMMRLHEMQMPLDAIAVYGTSLKTTWNELQWSMMFHKWKPVDYDELTYDYWWSTLKTIPWRCYERRKKHDVKQNRVWEIERDREAQPRRRKYTEGK